MIWFSFRDGTSSSASRNTKKVSHVSTLLLCRGAHTYAALGYSGVAIYTRNSACCPIRAEEGITGILCPPKSATRYRDLPPDQQIGGYPEPSQSGGVIDEAALDSEGRCVILEFPALVLIGVYSPASRDETRTDFRLAFINAMDARVRNLVAMGKRVILAGDLNIIRDELDTAKLQDQLRREGMTTEEFFSMPSRRFFNQLLFGGKVFGGKASGGKVPGGERDEGREQPVMWDLCREFHPTRQGMFTCWETKKNARPGNYGSRIDYIVCSDDLKPWFTDANIQEGLLGSDHCPVYATLADVVKVGGTDTHIKDIMNPPGMVSGGVRLREWTSKDCLPLSAKLIPEFDRRQTILTMFRQSKSGQPVAETETEPSSSTQLTMTDTEPRSSASASQSSQEVSLPMLSAAALPPVSGTSSPSKRSADIPSQLGRPQKKSKASLAREPSGKSSAGLSQKSASLAREPSGKSSAGLSQKSASLAREPAGKSSSALSQSSLRGFFKPKTTASPDLGGSGDSTADDGLPDDSTREAPPIRPRGAASAVGKDKDAAEKAADAADAATKNEAQTERKNDAQTEQEARVFDPIENKESWSKLLGKRVAPRCEHDEPCISLVTKKPGINCGTFLWFLPVQVHRFLFSLSVKVYCPLFLCLLKSTVLLSFSAC